MTTLTLFDPALNKYIFRCNVTVSGAGFCCFFFVRDPQSKCGRVKRGVKERVTEKGAAREKERERRERRERETLRLRLGDKGSEKESEGEKYRWWRGPVSDGF